MHTSLSVTEPIPYPSAPGCSWSNHPAPFPGVLLSQRQPAGLSAWSINSLPLHTQNYKQA